MKIDRNTEWGTYGKNPNLDNLHLQFVPIKQLSNPHIMAILMTQPHVQGELRHVFVQELKYRRDNNMFIADVDTYVGIETH